MKVLFVHFGPFDSNSGIQAIHFGDELTTLGWEVTLACEGSPARAFGSPRFECISHRELASRRRWRLTPEDSLICAWTPREVVRRHVERLHERLGVPYAVHLEDNEEHLLSAALGRPIGQLRALPPAEQDALAGDDLAHPTRYPRFLRNSLGVTMITAELRDFVPDGLPARVVRPGIDTSRFSPDAEPATSRRRLGLGEDEFVLAYHGHMHYANQHEMLSLYLAVQLLRRERRPARLLRIGHTIFGGVDQRAAQAMGEGVRELGPVSWELIPGHLVLADAFVQPGAPDDFNRYRLPSKLPEFLAMGRPVVLPACNIGAELDDGRDALLLREGGAIEIAEKLRGLMDDPGLRSRLGVAGRAFAAERLSWRENAAAMSDFFGGLIASGSRAATGAGVG
jgi:glycosyltransferase involved in cell wall biosynthesis